MRARFLEAANRAGPRRAVCREVLADLETPVSVLARFAEDEHVFLLESDFINEHLLYFIGTELAMPRLEEKIRKWIADQSDMAQILYMILIWYDYRDKIIFPCLRYVINRMVISVCNSLFHSTAVYAHPVIMSHDRLFTGFKGIQLCLRVGSRRTLMISPVIADLWYMYHLFRYEPALLKLF